MPKISDRRLAERRAQILQGARRAFARHGYEGATVRILETETGLSRGAIFHHYADKEALFLALAEQDAQQMAATVAEHGLVQVMRDLQQAADDQGSGWLGVQLEVRRKVRTDPAFAARWDQHQNAVLQATAARLERQRSAGVVRDDVPLELLVDFLRLVFDGLVSGLAAGTPGGLRPSHLPGVLDLVEDAVRQPPPRPPAGPTSVSAEPTEGARA